MSWALRLGAVFVCLGISVGLSGPGSGGAAAPGPRVLVARAATVMDRISSLAATGTIRLQSGPRRSHLNVAGVCDASAVPRKDRASNGIGTNYLKARAHLWGRLLGKSFDARYILIGHGRLLRLWERSAQTHNKWQVNRTEGTVLPVLDMCSILFMSPGGTPTNTPATYMNLGETMIAGAGTWHVRMTVNPPGEHWRFDWYIDAQSFRVPRYVVIVRDANSRSASTYAYSRFGVPVRITAPVS